MTNNELNALKRKIGELLGWNIRDFELIRSGKKGGRPNWEVEHHDSQFGKNRFAFTAFDANDIDGLHEVKNTEPTHLATIELPDNIPGTVIEPLEVPERDIPEDFNI